MRVLAPLALAAALLVGMGPPSPSELQQRADRFVAKSGMPGVIVLYEQDGERTVVASGEADLASGAALQPDARTWVGSITKTFVAVVVMQLVEEGKLRLDDPVSRLLPGRLRAGRRIRLRNLLNHSSGLPDYMHLDPWVSAVARNPRVVIPSRRLVSSATRLPLDFRPGSRVSYSNTNYLVLGEIVERVTRRPLEDALRTRIFEPLELHTTAYESGRRTLANGQIHGYDVTGTPPRDVSRWGLGGPWADGAIVSSVGDLDVFLGALLRGQLLPPRRLAQMTTIARLPGSHGEGLGIYRMPSPCGRWYYGNAGGTPGYVTWMGASRDASRIVILAVNGVSSTALDEMGRYLDELICRK